MKLLVRKCVLNAFLNTPLPLANLRLLRRVWLDLSPFFFNLSFVLCRKEGAVGLVRLRNRKYVLHCMYANFSMEHQRDPTNLNHPKALSLVVSVSSPCHHLLVPVAATERTSKTDRRARQERQARKPGPADALVAVDGAT